MSNTNFIAAGKSGGAEKASAVSKGAMPRRPVNTQRMQNVLLIWLDNNIDDNNKDCRNTVTQLRRVVNDINTYTNGDKCIQFIETITNNKICMIISGALGQYIVPRVHNISQVDSIFIFCENKKRHEQWAKEWPKIKGVFTEITPICEALKKAAQRCEQNAISISLVAPNTDDASSKTLDRLDPSFMYTQILKEILLTIKFEQKHIQEFIDYSREKFPDNEEELAHIKQVERKYHDKTPIYWYTCQIFLYPMLNLALRLMNVDIIVRMGFFISDLHRQIEQLHLKQYGDYSSRKSFTVYRGQGLSTAAFEQLTKTKGGLISFNNFLSTSKDRKISLGFANQAATNPDLVDILFVMKIDPTKSTTPFALISDVSYFQEESEVLFSMHSVFRINDIKPMGGNNRLYEVNLTLTSDNDADLCTLTNCIREESFPNSSGWYRLGLLLIKMSQSDKAEKVYEVLLGQTTSESEKESIYHQLGWVKFDQGEYQEAVTLYEKSLAIHKKTLSPNDLNLAWSYLNIGSVRYSMGDYSKALSSYEKALAIQQQSLPPNHPGLASSYMGIGSVYYKMGDYSKALSSHEKAFAIQQQSLPPNHPDLASSYLNTGSVRYKMGDYSKALSSYEKARAIQQQSLPPNHPSLAFSYLGIGLAYYKMGDYSKALSLCEKALEIGREALPSNHPDLVIYYNSIGEVCRKMGEHSTALSSHEKALRTQQPLSPNHPDLASSYMGIGLAYYKMGDYSKALSYHEKELAIRQQSLPPNHPDLGMSYNNIGVVYKNMGNYPKALSSYGKALEIRQQSLPPNHPDVGASYNNIGLVYDEMGNYSKARSYYERAVKNGEQSLPSTHLTLQQRRKNLELVKKKL